MDREENCKCVKIVGHLEDVNWITSPRIYQPSTWPLSLEDWTRDPHIWLHYVESADGSINEDDVLKSTHTKYWSIHDVQRYFLGELHCEQVLFTYQYPNLKMPSRLGNHLWMANTALKLPSTVYMKELHMSLEKTLKKMEAKQVQLDRLLVSDQLIKIDRLDDFKRKTFFKLLQNIIGKDAHQIGKLGKTENAYYKYKSFAIESEENIVYSIQESLQMVSLENLGCKRLEGVRIIQQLACFASHSLKYLFLWRFFLSNENPILVNYSYITDEEKCKLAKLLQGLEVPEIKLPERCNELIKEFHDKYDEPIGNEDLQNEVYENPYIPDRALIEENERKLKELVTERKWEKKLLSTGLNLNAADSKRPWRTNSNREKLFRIEKELQQHRDRASLAITPMEEEKMNDLITECQEKARGAPPVGADRLRETVDEAMRNLPNFQYKSIPNSTATAILFETKTFDTPTPTSAEIESIK